MRVFDTLNRHTWGAERIKTSLKFIVMSLLLFILASCEQTSEQVRVRTLSAGEFYPVALQRARQWKQDAYLAQVFVDFLVEGSSRHILLSYGFESPGDDRHSLLVRYAEDSTEPEVKELYHEVPIQVRNPINRDDWPLDSVDILPLAQDHGGNEFLAMHDHKSVITYLSLWYSSGAPGARLLWRASYFDVVTRDMLDIDLDPRTGEIVEVE